ncbi:uracil-xanthine permease family protein [Flammeovirga kamogawensis]|uniref:NCS2 family nucleobase:cation symporter n=1 Tax=Flammeovirga kamogawensis TaxID=373891 RepID=A0ABX8GZT4_9BACT|nr:solute carrier family 23 protein [Flammeovirga kamogawensis]MBB6459524.1 uracil permease [Flammeovirga kamogawensis]QWG09075.1 NCS2 family nucleobase:cation symporter [Flammeovirga kamogawensis]TRX67363.1 uracil permease [Flammeovirga kamogawensis]
MDSISGKTKYLLGVQHVLAMFGATVLVPFLTGLSPVIALFTAGCGTLIFHQVTKKIVPVFLGSSFAFIGAISLVLKQEGLAEVKAGIIGAGLVYVLMAFIIKKFGVKGVQSFFPPIVIGPTIMVIGLRLSPIALQMAGYNDGTFDTQSLIIALSVIITMVISSMVNHSFFKLMPILIAVTVGYLLAAILGVVDYTAIKNAHWFGFTGDTLDQVLTLPHFSWSGFFAIAPIALVVFIEHIGDITTNGAVVGKDFFKNPGIHRTMLGDGLATIFAGCIGGPANTTYGENTGVLAVTKVYDPSVIRIAAVFAILLSFIGKVGAILQTIPVPVMGGISIILFGMIAAVGVRTLISAKLDFGHSRNLIIAALIFVLGIGIKDVAIWNNISVSGLTIAALVGVLLNKILPKDI